MQPLRAAETIVPHGESFATGSRKVVVLVPAVASQYRGELVSFLSSCGAVVMNGFFAELIYPSVRMVHGDLDHGAEGFTIKVRKNKIQIRYTSDAQARRALDYLRTMYETPQGRRLIRGADVSIKQRKEGAVAVAGKGAGVFARPGVVDGISTHLSSNVIKSTVSKLVAGGYQDPILAIASDKIFRVDFYCLKVFNSSTPILKHGLSYQESEMKMLLAQMVKSNIRLVIGFDLLSPSPMFEQWSGHALNSVEGMRVVRAVVEEMAQSWGVSRLCVGVSDSLYAKDKRYMTFLQDICKRNSVEMIVL